MVRNFTSIVESLNCKIFPNTKVGSQISLNEIRDSHDAVVIASGPGPSKKLSIPSEGLTNSVNSGEFVGWYNSDPLKKNVSIDLNGVKKVAIIGHGNVALDIARILLRDPRDFYNYQVSQNVIDQLGVSQIEEVNLFGRRGPLQVLHGDFNFNTLGFFRECRAPRAFQLTRH